MGQLATSLSAIKRIWKGSIKVAHKKGRKTYLFLFVFVIHQLTHENELASFSRDL